MSNYLLVYPFSDFVKTSFKAFSPVDLINTYANSIDPGQMALFAILLPVVQSIVSLTSSLVVKISTVLVCIISNSQVFLLKKCE